MISFYAILIALSAIVFSFGTSFLVLKYLQFSDLQDIPNERSNHAAPTPRGGGLAIVATLIFFLIGSGAPNLLVWAILGCGIISYLDDCGGVPVLYRLAVHFGAAILALISLPDVLFFQGLIPPALDFAAATLLLVFWLNVYNFMDGIDGITGAQTVAMGVGVAILVAVGSKLYSGAAIDALAMAGAALGFLAFNWHPAKMFMGDVGSIPLGLMSGFLMFYLASHGHWHAALILPAYYVVDGGYTFLKRLLTGHKPWKAHSQHAYQQAVRRLIPHNIVVRRIAVINSLLIMLAVVSVSSGRYALFAVAIAYLLAILLRISLAIMRPTPEILLPHKR